VTRDRSLEEFATGGTTQGPGTEPTAEDSPDPAAAADGSERTGPEKPGATDSGGPDLAGDTPAEPLTTTYQWSPAQRRCGACGESVTVRWRGEDGFVCGDCKEW